MDTISDYRQKTVECENLNYTYWNRTEQHYLKHWNDLLYERRVNNNYSARNVIMNMAY